MSVWLSDPLADAGPGSLIWMVDRLIVDKYDNRNQSNSLGWFKKIILKGNIQSVC